MSRNRKPSQKPVIGLTGGIGSGKSTVARILESLGAAVIDADQLIHDELAQPDVAATVRSWWGEDVCTPDGRVDRQAVAAIVFERPEELKRLETLLYPRVERKRESLCAAFEADASVGAIVLDAPKLFEAGWDRACDSVIFVDAPRDERLRRVAARRGWNGDELDRREKWLMPLDKKRARADDIVVNHSSIAELRSDIELIFRKVLAACS